MGKPINTAKALSHFRKIFHETIDISDHHISSPLGAWMLLAFLSDGAENGKIEQLLGMNSKNSRKVLARMLAADADGVTALVKGWVNPVDRQRFAKLLERNSFAENIDLRIPSKDELDAWVAKETREILTEFPLTPDSSTMAIFASIIATEISWHVPFKVLAADESWASWKVDHILYDNEVGKSQFYKVDGKLYIAHIARSLEAVAVYSVLPLNGEVTSQELLGATDSIATGQAEQVDHRFTDEISMNMLETVFTRVGMRATTDYEDFFFTAELPAWKTEDRFNLQMPALGFATACELEGQESIDVCQAVKASFQTSGFKAAAVTAVMIGRGAAFIPTDRVPIYNVKFNSRFAVSVVSSHEAFKNLPLFTGIISKAVEPDPQPQPQSRFSQLAVPASAHSEHRR